MSPVSAAPRSEDPSELPLLLRQLKEDTILLALPGFFVAAILLSLNEAYFARRDLVMLPGLVMILWPGLVYVLRRVSYLAAAWGLVVGWALGVLLVACWTGVTPAIQLLALPAGYATLFIGLGAGLAVGVGSTLALYLLPASLLPPDPALRLTAAFGLWSPVALVWLTLRPLIDTMDWSWSNYRQSRRLLEQARDYQVQLKQTLADLADANLQLTRLNRLTQSLRQAAEEARRAKEQFVANVSHEFRTPLNMIIGFGEMILQAPKTYGKIPPALLADLSVIVRNSQHLAGLIDDVLDLSQIEAEQMALTRERVSLAEIVEAAVIAVRPLFAGKGLYLETDVPADSMVYCDRTRIREVVLNLLSNAGRFTDQGGVRVRAWRAGAEYWVSVTDTGPGIAEEDRDKLFQPFQQLDGSLRRRYGGTGLGLAISKSCIELHGGRMWVESEAGRGSTFYFRLPVDPPPRIDAGVSRWFSPYAHYEERTHRPLAPAPVVRPRFVVLDANSALERLLARYLDTVEVAPVATLEEASAELAQRPAQALLVNGASVAETLQRLKGMAPLPFGMPAVVCSLPGPMDAADELGVAGYLTKPISREVLLGTLSRLPLRGNTVLVVDDEPDAQQLFWRMLAAEPGYRVLTASNGREAMDILHREQPAVVLMDLVMPEMDGFRLLEARSQDPALRDIPFVVISARDPAGEPIVSDALAVMRGGGISIPQVLACIEAISRILGGVERITDPAAKAAPSG